MIPPNVTLASAVSWVVWTATRIALGLLLLGAIGVGTAMLADHYFAHPGPLELKYAKAECPSNMDEADLRLATFNSPKLSKEDREWFGACLRYREEDDRATDLYLLEEHQRRKRVDLLGYAASGLALVLWAWWYQRRHRVKGS